MKVLDLLHHRRPDRGDGAREVELLRDVAEQSADGARSTTSGVQRPGFVPSSLNSSGSIDGSRSVSAT